jgi:hypothetical protein
MPKVKPSATRTAGPSQPRSMEYFTRKMLPSAIVTAPSQTNHLAVRLSSSPPWVRPGPVSVPAVTGAEASGDAVSAASPRSDLSKASRAVACACSTSGGSE